MQPGGPDDDPCDNHDGAFDSHRVDEIMKRGKKRMKIKPLNDRVLIKRKDADKMTPGGLYIPETAREKQVMQAEVIAVGPGAFDDSGQRRPVGVSPGQVVIVSRYGGTDVEIDGEKYQVVQEDDLQGVVE